ncbi:ribonuclease H-like domain-containing protein, partial [Tanacetum coccineum]
SKFDYSLFTKKSGDVFVALLVYVDDVVITENNLSGIEKFKVFLKFKFQIKDLGKLKHFLGIEVFNNADGICLSQRKYYLRLLYDYGLLAAKHVDTPLPENTTLNNIESDDDKFQFMHAPLESHLDVSLRVLRYLKGSLGSGIQINKNEELMLILTGQDVLLPGNLFLDIVMASATCEIIWLSNLLGDMGVKGLLPVVLYCDNNSALQIAANPVFHEK